MANKWYSKCFRNAEKKYVLLNACVLSHSVVSDSVTLWAGDSLPGSSVHGIFQARILVWVAISSSRGSSGPRDWTHISCISCTGKWILYHCATWEAHWKNEQGINSNFSLLTSLLLYGPFLGRHPSMLVPWSYVFANFAKFRNFISNQFRPSLSTVLCPSHFPWTSDWNGHEKF